MANQYWHSNEKTSDPHDVANEIFFQTDDAVITDATVRANWIAGTRFAASDGTLLDPTMLHHLEKATVADYDAWYARRIV